MSLIGNFAAKAGLRERRSGVRVAPQRLEAFYSTGGKPMRVAIKDIGPTGICLTAPEAMPLGSQVALTLQRKAVDDADCGTKVSMPTKVARVGKREVGLEFVHRHIDTAGWTKLVLQAAQLGRNDGVRVFRVAKALAFLRRISPPAEAQFVEAMAGGMSYDGEERALEIILQAEDVLWSHGHNPGKLLDARLVQRILDHGVNLDTRDAAMAHFWAGLLAAATLEGTEDQETFGFAELLSRMDLVSMRILAAACENTMAGAAEGGFGYREMIHLSAGELKKTAGVTNFQAIDRGLDRLQELGLVNRAEKAAAFEPVEDVDLAPTALGLRLHARCTGRPEAPDLCGAGGKRTA